MRPDPERLLDEAIELLHRRGFAAGDGEVVDLLASHNALVDRSDERVRIRPALLREMLSNVPSGFNLHDRSGRKVRTLAGGADLEPGPPMQATTLPSTNPVAPERLPDLCRDQAEGGGFDILGEPACPGHLPGPLGDLYPFFWGMLTSRRPRLLRPRDPEVLDGLRSLMSVLRGSPQKALETPFVVVESIAAHSLVWPPAACRILIDGARRGLPVAVVTPPAPARATKDEAWVIEAAAMGIAGVTIHQLARGDAPVLWGVPFVQPMAPTPEARGAWRALIAVGDLIGMPTHVTLLSRSRSNADLWAAEAALAGVSLIAWGDATRDTSAAIEIARMCGAAAEPAEAAVALDASVTAGLTRVLRHEADRLGAGRIPLPEGVPE